VADPYLRIQPTREAQGDDPVLLRCVFYPLRETWRGPDYWLKQYPAETLYGGPTLAKYLTNRQGAEFRRGLVFWAMSTRQENLADQLVPIAPDRWPSGSSAPRWPKTGWRWWFVRETQPRQLWALERVRPDFWDWRPV
jgi:hypothetical protein